MSIRTASLALLAGLTFAAPTAAFANPAPRSAEVVKSDQAPAPAPTDQAATYADREAQSQAVGEYEGGNTVVIAMSGGAFVVLLFLLLIL